MKRTYNLEVCRCFNNRPTDQWSVLEWFIPTKYNARQYLYGYAGGLEDSAKLHECMQAAPYEIVLAKGYTFDMCDTVAFRIVEAVEE